MKKFIISIFLMGCAVGNAATVSNDQPMAHKDCRIANSEYRVDFTKIDGDCPTETALGYIWFDDSTDQIIFPSGCTNYAPATACTNYLDEVCYTWLYKEQMSGEMDWSAGGTYAHGYLTFTSFLRDDGSYSCSSVYETTYTYQWTAAN